jgi:hypothetical protein
MRKQWAQEAAFYDDYAASLLPEHGEAIRKEVEELLDAEVRSASLVENIHAALRSLLDTCRGQVDQDIWKRLGSMRCWQQPDAVREPGEPKSGSKAAAQGAVSVGSGSPKQTVI